MPETGTREEPFLAYNFLVEINGLVVAGFSEVSGLSTETEVIEYRNGNHPVLSTMKFAGLRTYMNISLRRGMTAGLDLWDWRLNILNGAPDRRNGAVILLDEQRSRVAEWRFRDAWPVSYEGASLNAQTNEIAVESMNLAHEGLVRV